MIEDEYSMGGVANGMGLSERPDSIVRSWGRAFQGQRCHGVTMKIGSPQSQH